MAKAAVVKPANTARRVLRGFEIWTTPKQPGRLPIGKQTWLNGVARGIFPQPLNLGPGVVVWREDDIAELERKGTGRPDAGELPQT
jgi:hypothetical protein